MIGTIRKHQQWLWVIIILAIIVSFVVYFSPNSQSILESQDNGYNFGTIKGRAITQEEYRNARNEIELFFFLRSGKWPGADDLQQSGIDIERETYSRIMLAEKLKELDVQPTVTAAAKWIAEVFQGTNNEPFPIDRYNNFVKNELTPRRMTSDDFYRFARHQVGQQHLISVFGLGGKLITPQEAESFYRRMNEPLVTEAVFFSASNYLSSVSSTSESLGQFYTNNMAEYRLPERIQVNYVKWEVTNFFADADKELAKITNLSQRIDAVYAQRGTNVFKDDNGTPLSAEAAKAKIKETERKQLAAHFARKQAADFIKELYQGHDDDNPFKPDDLEKLAKAKGLVMKTTQPFDQREGPKELNVPPQFVSAAFQLRNDDPDDKGKERLFRSAAIEAEDGFYVIGFNKRLPSVIQPFEQVREQIARDYREEETSKLARQAGATFAKTLTNGIAQGKTFSEIIAQEKVKPVSLPEFSLSTRSLPELGERATLDSLQSVAVSVPPGSASGFIPTATGGFVLHVKAKLPVDTAKLNAELPEFLARQREQRMSAAFSDWFQKLPQEMRLVPPAKSSSGKS